MIVPERNNLFQPPLLFENREERMRLRIFCLALMFSLSSYGIITYKCLGLSHAGFNVYVDPENTTVRVGRTFSVNITVSQVSSPGIYAFGLKLLYDNSLLEPVSAEIPTDHFLKSTLSPEGVFIIDPGTINKTKGTVSFAATLIGNEPAKTGNGTLARIEFVVMTSGNSTLIIGDSAIREPKFVDGDGNTISDQSFSISNGYVEGLPLPPPTIPPPPPEPGKQTLTFNFMGMYGYVTFPEEYRAEDIITHTVIVAAEPEGVHLNYFRLNISCDTSLRKQILYNETIENQYLQESWTLNETIELAIPEDAYGKLECIIEAETYKQFTACDSALQFDTTTIVTVTYEELQTAYEELLGQYNKTVTELEQMMIMYKQLNTTYQKLLSEQNTTLQQLNYWMSAHESLNKTYNQLLQDYVSLNMSYTLLQDNYEQLETDYNELSEKDDSLNSTYIKLEQSYTNLTLSIDKLEHNFAELQTKYDNLYEAYDSLNSTYYAVLTEYDELKLEENPSALDLLMSRTLWYTFATTTVAACAYIIYSAEKKK
jgi:predicted  nucleic acid-binding Zn-ribbon protein